MLISIPERQGKSRHYDLGALGFPWLAVADIIIAGAHQGWSYYRTKQQIDQAKAVSGAPPASVSDVDAITNAILKQLGSDTPRPEVEEYVRKILSGAPDTVAQPPPSALLEARIAALEQREAPQPTGGMPTWGWIALGVLGFMVVSKSGMLGGGD